MFSTIPLNRLLLYIAFLAMIPPMLIFILFQSPLELRKSLENEINSTSQRALLFEKKQAINLAIRQQFLDADHSYIDKYLESLTLLEPETEALQQVVRGRDLAENETINKRLDLLSGKGNKIVFSEGVVESYPYFQDTAETLTHPVEIDIEDLKKILSIVEGVKISPYTPPPGRPELIILDLKLEKKNVSPNNQVFLLNMKLLKREFS